MRGKARPGKKGRRGLKVLVLFAVAILAVLATGRPQEWLFERAAASAIGARVDVEWGGMFGDLRLISVRVYGRPGDTATGAPFAVAKGVRIDYTLRLGAPVDVRAIHIDELEIVADGANPDDENYAFIRALLEQPPPPEKPAYYPDEIAVGALTVHATLPDLYLRAGPMKVDITMETLETIGLSVETESLEASWWVESPDWQHNLSRGKGRLSAESSGNTLRVEFTADVPEMGQVDGHGSLVRGDDSMRFELSLDSLLLEGARFTDIAEQFLPVEVAFEELRLLEFSIQGETAEGVWPEVAVTADIDDLRIGKIANEWYAGDARVAIAMDGGTETKGTASAILAEGQGLNIQFLAGADTRHLEASFDEWSSSQFVGAIPAAFRAPVEEIEFATVSGRFEGNWSESNFDLNLRLESRTDEPGSSLPILVGLEVTGSVGENLSLEGELETRLGDEFIQATAYIGSKGEFHADVLVNDVGLGPWFSFFLGERLPEDTSATLAGTLTIASTGESAPLTIVPSLVLKSVRYGEVTFARIDLTGVMTVSSDLNDLVISELEAVADDAVSRLTLTDWKYTRDNRKGSGRVSGALDLALLPPAAELEELYGSSTFEATFELDGTRIQGPISFVSDYIGYGDLALPYGTELRGEARLDFSADDSTGILHELLITAGEGTRATVPKTVFTLSPFQASGNFDFESDLQLFVELGWFQSAEGTVREQSEFRISDEGLWAQWDVAFDASRLVLPEDAARVSDLRFSVAGTYDGELDGEGRFTMGVLSVAGGTVRASEGGVRLEGTRLLIPAAKGTLFGGALNSTIEVGILEAEFPVHLKADFEGIDLAVLTNEVQPPKTKLTGIADGQVELKYSLQGLAEFYLTASSNQNFSINRDLLKELINMEEYLGGMRARIAERVLTKILGAEPQRPFDSADLYISLSHDAIGGVAELKYEKSEVYTGMDLLVNLDIDQASFAEALRVLERTSMASMEL